MSVAIDIIRAWRMPRQMMTRRLQTGPREDLALMYLFVACVIIFVAQWPRLWRDALNDPSIPFDYRLGGALLAWLFIVPLALYGVAAMSHIVARLLGGQGSWFGARLALFWSLLVAAPLWLLNGLFVVIFPQNLAGAVAAIIALAMFLFVWLASLFQAETIRGPIL
jgi:hypothetical protein